MPFVINDEIIKHTKNCCSRFNCLTAEGKPICTEDLPMCSVKHHHVESKLIFVEPAKYFYCSYLRPYGSGFICKCPVRYELHKRFNK